MELVIKNDVKECQWDFQDCDCNENCTSNLL